MGKLDGLAVDGSLDVGEHGFERDVAVAGIVVEHHGTARGGLAHVPDEVTERRVPPADACSGTRRP